MRHLSSGELPTENEWGKFKVTHLLLALNPAIQSLKVQPQASCETSEGNDRPHRISPKWCSYSEFPQKEIISFTDDWVLTGTANRLKKERQEIDNCWRFRIQLCQALQLWGADNITVSEKKNVLKLIFCYSEYKFDQGVEGDAEKVWTAFSLIISWSQS